MCKGVLYIFHVKTDDNKNIAKNVEKNTSNYEVDRPLPMGKN